MRSRGERGEKRTRREGMPVSNYNGYNGIICLRIVAAKHCCTVKCFTINVHRAHNYILLLSSCVWSLRTQTHCTLSRFGLSMHLRKHTHYIHVRTHTRTIHARRLRELCRQTLHLSISCIRFRK